MNLRTLETTRLEIQDQYTSLLLQQNELDIRPRAKLNIGGRVVEVHCFRVWDERVPLGEPLVFTFHHALNFGPDELERMISHVRTTIHLNQLI